MKNILNEKPDSKLTERLKFSSQFVEDKDIKGKKILDIGCGFGWFELNVLKRGCSEISGIEISSNDLKTAKENIKDKRAIFKIGGALKLPFKDNYFDTIVAWEVIEHIPDSKEDKMFKEVYRVLKKGGVFYLSTPYDSFFSKYLDPAFWFIGHRHYSREKLARFGKENKFRLSVVYIKGGWWGLISLLDMYFSKWIFKRKPFLENIIVKKADQEYNINRNGLIGIFVKYEK